MSCLSTNKPKLKMSEMDADLNKFVNLEDFGLIPPEIIAAADEAVANLVPKKSKDRYEAEFDSWEAWMKEKNVTVINETVLLAYFSEKVCNK